MNKIAPIDITIEDILNKKPKSNAQRPAWYLDKDSIRPKKQFRWTLKERAILYKMRIIQNKSISDIQKYFRIQNNIPIILGINDKNDKFSRTRLHNQIRLIRGSFNGLCHQCRKKLTKSDLKRINRIENKEDPSFGLCLSCTRKYSKYKRNKRLEILADGICPICVKNKVIKGHTTCKKCLSSSHRYRYLDGLCGRCGKNPLAENSIALCEECLDINRKTTFKARYKKLREEKKAAALKRKRK